MTPTRYATNTRGSIGSRHMNASCEIEFEQRELFVNAYGPKVEGSRYLSYRHLYREYRQYSRELLSAQRSLIRNKMVHNYVPRLSQHDPRIQYWLDQAEDPTSRQDSPHFLARDAVHRFQKHCRYKSWDFKDWADSVTHSLVEWADRKHTGPPTQHDTAPEPGDQQQ